MPRAARPVPALAAIGDTPLTALPGCGPRVAEKFAARGLHCLQDLWLQLPRQYEDRTRLTRIADLQPGVAAQVEGRVEAVERGFRYRPVLRVALDDGSRATLVLRFFHFRAAQVAQFQPGTRVRCYGTARPGQNGLEIVHPSYRVIDDDEADGLGDALDPVYPSIEGIGPATLRRLIGLSLDRLPGDEALELLPPDLRAALRLPSLREALLAVHRPGRDQDVAALLAGTHPAQRRLALEELLAHHLSLRRQRIAQQAHAAPVLDRLELAARLRDALPFPLTGAQQRVFDQIADDLGRPTPMLRLVQGDVGTGVLASVTVQGEASRCQSLQLKATIPQRRRTIVPVTLRVTKLVRRASGSGYLRAGLPRYTTVLQGPDRDAAGLRTSFVPQAG